ncbi:MAG: SMC-Scp complex subunit ScpB [Tissierellia bacterium]|nr:SMC-Scp complex subunit ScpB [Tissierellia bacterium]
MDRQHKKAIEAILFLWGEPLELTEIARALDVSKKDARLIIEEMKEEFQKDERGLMIKKVGDCYQLQTVKEVKGIVSKFVEKQKVTSLSSGCMETLAIIAYKQPVTRIDIENLRGVSSTSTIQTLQKRGLIEEAGRLDQIGRPILYRTTNRFLQSFNLEDLKDLPQLTEMEKYKIEQEKDHATE